MDDRQWATFLAQQNIQATGSGNAPRTFTPTWTGFSVPPVGTINYHAFGSVVAMWTDGVLIGTSNATTMAITNIPAEILPRTFADGHFHVTDNGISLSGGLSIGSNGTAIFFLDSTSAVANRVSPDIAAFTAAGNKGLSDGWTMLFAR